MTSRSSRPGRNRMSVGSDAEIARALQLEEDEAEAAQFFTPSVSSSSAAAAARPQTTIDRTLAAAAGLNGALAAAMAAIGFGGSSSSSRLGVSNDRPDRSSYAVEHCSTSTRCRGCQRHISPGELQISYRRSSSEPVSTCHPLCLGIIPDVAALMATAMANDAQVQFAPSVTADERAAVEAELEALADQPAGSIADFSMFGPSGRDVRRRPSRLQRRLLGTDRDFTAEDYEMLLQLDEAQSSSRSSKKQHRAEAEAVLSMLPISAMSRASAGTECMVCLESMDEGCEVRTLPCMHIFHRKCIDRWFAEPGRPPRCPIDQTKVEPTGD
eukprot:TRINITY_DN1274_c0_g1_i1.p1 TRINITY_DN1274_c0_g1~~TRINITY_DN1274_c0_g1_i1.p1  ORF type:complete len:382 (-),score=74.87 TRINITY_DN1274_c0_g1_i1:155-1135(-)